MYKRMLLALMSVIVLGAITTAAPAFAAHEWRPAKGKPEATSANFDYTIKGGPTLTCSKVTAVGPELTGVAKVWTTLPKLTGCSTPVTTSGTWSVTDVSKTAATLTLPKEGMVMTFGGACTVTWAPLESIIISGAYHNGKSAVTEPSTWTFTEQVVPIRESSANCTGDTEPGGATSVIVTATFAVANIAPGATAPIEAT